MSSQTAEYGYNSVFDALNQSLNHNSFPVHKYHADKMKYHQILPKQLLVLMYALQDRITNRIRTIIWHIKMSIFRVAMRRHEYNNIMELGFYSARPYTYSRVIKAIISSGHMSYESCYQLIGNILNSFQIDVFVTSTLDGTNSPTTPCTRYQIPSPLHRYGSGTKKVKSIKGTEIVDYVIQPLDFNQDIASEYRFVSYIHGQSIGALTTEHKDLVVTDVPLSVVCNLMNRRELQVIA